ncbi:MAG: hypothetical protein ACPGXY_04310 [Alphaproteobacteria bacterium]
MLFRLALFVFLCLPLHASEDQPPSGSASHRCLTNAIECINFLSETHRSSHNLESIIKTFEASWETLELVGTTLDKNAARITVEHTPGLFARSFNKNIQNGEFHQPYTCLVIRLYSLSHLERFSKNNGFIKKFFKCLKLDDESILMLTKQAMKQTYTFIQNAPAQYFQEETFFLFMDRLKVNLNILNHLSEMSFKDLNNLKMVETMRLATWQQLPLAMAMTCYKVMYEIPIISINSVYDALEEWKSPTRTSISDQFMDQLVTLSYLLLCDFKEGLNHKVKADQEWDSFMIALLKHEELVDNILDEEHYANAREQFDQLLRDIGKSLAELVAQKPADFDDCLRLLAYTWQYGAPTTPLIVYLEHVHTNVKGCKKITSKMLKHIYFLEGKKFWDQYRSDEPRNGHLLSEARDHFTEAQKYCALNAGNPSDIETYLSLISKEYELALAPSCGEKETVQ